VDKKSNSVFAKKSRIRGIKENDNDIVIFKSGDLNWMKIRFVLPLTLCPGNVKFRPALSRYK